MPDEMIVTNDQLLRIEKGLNSAKQWLGDPDVPPTVRIDVEEALRSVQDIRGRMG